MGSAFALNPHHDKVMVGYFTAFYDDLLSGRSVQSILEIGVRDGDSMLLWRSGFPDALLYGMDIAEKPGRLDGDDKIVFIRGDAYTERSALLAAQMRVGGYDVVIDDGQHSIESQEFFLRRYADVVAHGGLMVLEDISDVMDIPRLCECVDTSRFSVRPIVVPPEMMDEPFRSQFRSGIGVIVAERLALT